MDNDKVTLLDLLDLVRIATPGDHSWIRVRRYTDNPSEPVEARLAKLTEHHLLETAFLLATCQELAKELLHARGESRT